MEEPVEHNKKRRIWPWITLAVILVLLTGLRLALRSDLLLDYIRSEVETRVSDMLKGELRIDRMSGDLWSYLDVEGVRLYLPGGETGDGQVRHQPGTDPNPIVLLDSLHVSWSIADLIFRRPLEIRKLHALGFEAALVQEEDGSWNVMDLFPDDFFTDVDEPDEEPSGFRFVLSDVRFTAPEISVDARELMPGEPLSVRDLEAQFRLGVNEAGLFADLRKLDLFLHESRLDAPVQLSSEASWDGRRITLDRLLIASAYTFFEASGGYNPATSATSLQALLDPLSWREVEAYVDEYPIRQDLNVELHVGGSRQDLRAGLTLEAPGLDRLSIETNWSVMQEPVLTGLSVQSGPVDAATLTGDESLVASIGGMALALEGTVPIGEWDRVNVTGNFTLEDARFDDYSLDQLELGLAASHGTFRSDITVRKGDESITAALEAVRWWDDDLEWALSWQTRDLSPGFWAGMEELAGSVTMQGEATGKGYMPEVEPWTAAITLERLSLPDYPDVSADLEAEVTGERVKIVSPVRIDGAELDLEAEVLWSLDVPRYTASAAFRNLDAGVLPGLEQLATDINGRLELSGEGYDPQTMSLDATFLMAASTINRQQFEELTLDLRLREGIAFVDEARLVSVPATANLTLRQNIFDLYDLSNRMEFELELLDLQGFANLAGADTLDVRGRFDGTLHADTQGRLVLESSLNLHSIQFDTIRVEQLNGFASAVLAEETDFHADLEIRNPSVGPYNIRDITIETDGTLGENNVSGRYSFEFNVESESGLRQEAEYHVADTIRIRTQELLLKDPAATYRLDKPFDVLLAEDLVSVDTLRLVSNTGAEISLSLQKTLDTPWSGFIEALDTDLGQVQYIFLNEPLFEAIFTGRIGFRVDEEVLEVSGKTEIDAFQWDEVRLDSIRFDFDLAENRFTTDAAVWLEEAQLIRSELDLPFELTDPADLDEEFFDRPVSGYIRVNSFDITLFEEMLRAFGMEGMRGEFSLATTLSGMAGSPELTGWMRLEDGAMSGVAIDSLVINWDYDHGRSDLELASRIHSLGQKAADISGNVPLHLDFRTLEFDGPDPDDPVSFHIQTNEFNLASLNDFLDPAMLRNLQGRLNADIEVSGTMAEPGLDGTLVLSGGEVRVVENNITLRRMQMDVAFAPNRITLRRLSIQSVGSFGGQGEITLDGLTPDRLDLRFNATNFRAFNTRDREIYAGLDIRLSGTLDEPVLSGDVRWERGTLYLDDFGEREVEEVVLDEEVAAEREGPEFFERLGMEIKFSVDRNAFVRNRRDPEINLALLGEIDIVKQAFGELQIFGNMGVSSGQVTTFNKRFQVERGDVTFDGDPQNPVLDIRAMHRPRQQYEDIRIYYLITGNLEDPQFEFDSEPEMELQDIISYTLFGRPFHALAGWEQTMSGRSDGSMATNIAVDIMLDRIENLAADRLGIDVIEIENTRRGGGGTSIKAGKFVSDRLFIAFLQELGGTDASRQVIVEYLIQRNLELIITAGDDYRSGLDILWRYDY